MLPSGDLIGVQMDSSDWCLVMYSDVADGLGVLEDSVRRTFINSGSVGVEVEGIRADVRTVNVGVVGGVGEESSVVVNFREWRMLATASRELRWATPS